MGHEERFPLPRRVAAIGSVKGRSPEYPITTGKRRKRPFDWSLPAGKREAQLPPAKRHKAGDIRVAQVARATRRDDGVSLRFAAQAEGEVMLARDSAHSARRPDVLVHSE